MYTYTLPLVKSYLISFHPPVSVKPIRELLPDLRKERGWSREVLSHHAYRHDEDGTSHAQITAIERGSRRASARTMLALAKALGIEPTEFAEYRLALARLQLDEDLVGLDKAMSKLERSRVEPVDLTEQQIKSASHSGRRAASQAAKTLSRTRGRPKG